MASAAASRIRGRDREELAQELRRRVSGEVKFDPFSRVLYSTDASIYQMEPVGVVIPRSLEDVLAIMEVSRDNQVPVLPRAGGTSLAGQTVNHAIVIDFSKYLNQVLEVNQEEQWARVQPGIILDQLNQHLLPYGLQYAPDPTTSNRACVGGGIGNNTCGAHSVIYGKTLDHIKEVDVVLTDATWKVMSWRPSSVAPGWNRTYTGVCIASPGRTWLRSPPTTPRSCAGSAGTIWTISLAMDRPISPA